MDEKHRKPGRDASGIICACGLAVACTLLAYIVATQSVAATLCSDSLYGSAIARDLLEHGWNVAWSLPAAPYWFPDVFPNALVTVLVTRDPGLMMTVTYVMHLLLLGFALRFFFARVAGAERLRTPGLAALTCLTGYVACVAGHRVVWLFAPVCHTNECAVGLLLAGLAWGALNEGRRRDRWAYALVGFASVASDMSVFPHYVVPITVAVLLLRRGHGMSRRAAYQLAGISASFPVLAFAAERALDHSGYFNMCNPVRYAVRPGGIREALLRYFDDTAPVREHWVFCLLAGVLVVAGARILWAEARPKSRPVWLPPAGSRSGSALLFLAAITLVSLPVSAVTPALIGFSGGTGCIRYLWALYMLPLPFLYCGLLLSPAGATLPPTRLGLALLAGAASLAAVRVPGSSPASLRAPYRPLVAGLDALNAGGDRGWGLATYHHARLVTDLSRTGIRLSQVDPGLVPHAWANNLDAFLERRPDGNRWPPYSFVILDGLDPQRVRNCFGPPGEERVLGGSRVWLYPTTGLDARGLVRSYREVLGARRLRVLPFEEPLPEGSAPAPGE